MGKLCRKFWGLKEEGKVEEKGGERA